MLIIPAVDIKGGQCVRLLQGREDSETVFGDDPSAMAARWEAEGAQLLHVIDLDGAFNKSPQNIEAIERIVDSVHIPIQLGGGIRNMETVSMFLNLGVRRVILGTEAIRDPGLVEQACEAFPGQIIVGCLRTYTRTACRAAQISKRQKGSPSPCRHRLSHQEG